MILVLVAVKRLRSILIESDQDLADFVREGALLRRLNHKCAAISPLLSAHTFDVHVCQNAGYN